MPKNLESKNIRQLLAEASVIIEKHPIALQLRYLQTMAEVSTESNSTTIFPLPIELLRPFLSFL
jgi:hypothetical protein